MSKEPGNPNKSDEQTLHSTIDKLWHEEIAGRKAPAEDIELTGLLNPILLDYFTWDLKAERYSEINEAHSGFRVHAVDTYNLDGFIAAIIHNGIAASDFQGHYLNDSEAWLEWAKKNSIEDPARSFGFHIYYLATLFGEYYADKDIFFEVHEAGILEIMLNQFIKLLPVLSQGLKANGTNDFYFGENPLLDDEYMEDRSEEEIANLFAQRDGTRIRFVVSREDTIRLDRSLADMISQGMAILANRNLSYPVDLTPEAWKNMLMTISNDFTAYMKFGTPISSKVAELFVSRYRNFWD